MKKPRIIVRCYRYEDEYRKGYVGQYYLNGQWQDVLTYIPRNIPLVCHSVTEARRRATKELKMLIRVVGYCDKQEDGLFHHHQELHL